MVREVLSQYLVADGFEVIEAGDGDAAVASVAEHQPDLVLLDLMLPKRNGLDVLGFIRRTSALPVILLTARGDEADRVRGLEAGAEFELLNCFMAHPGEALTREDLLRKVWSSSTEWQDPSTVTVHVRRLRGRLEDDPSTPAHFMTVFGVGYRFDP